MSSINDGTAAWKAYELKFNAAIAAAAMEVALRLKGDVQRNIRGDRSKNPSKAITGEPPMNNTGTLRNSITGASSRLGFGVYEAIVGADTVYARALELGAPYNPPSWKNGERFPYIQPVVDKFAASSATTRIIRKHLGAING